MPKKPAPVSRVNFGRIIASSKTPAVAADAIWALVAQSIEETEDRIIDAEFKATDATRAERERCAKVIDDLRISEAGDFKTPKCQGQRGADRLDALYDAYCAVKNGMGEK